MMNEKEQLWDTRFLNYANSGMPRTHWCHENGTENPMHTGRAPGSLLENSLVSASFVTYIMKKKFVDGVPVYRQEADLKRKGIHLTRQTMSKLPL